MSNERASSTCSEWHLGRDNPPGIGAEVDPEVQDGLCRSKDPGAVAVPVAELGVGPGAEVRGKVPAVKLTRSTCQRRE